MSQPVTVVDLVAEARETVMTTLATFTGFREADLWEIADVVTVTMSIPPELVDAVAIATLDRFLQDRGEKPNTDEGRELLAMFDRVLAANIATASNLAIQHYHEMQARQKESQQKLKQGLLGH